MPGDKIVAALLALGLMLAVALGILLLVAGIPALWSAGILIFTIVIGITAGMFAIGWAFYHIILESWFS